MVFCKWQKHFVDAGAPSTVSTHLTSISQVPRSHFASDLAFLLIKILHRTVHQIRDSHTFDLIIENVVSMPSSAQVVAVAGGAAAAAAAAYLVYNSSNNATCQVVVFLDGNKKGLRIPKYASLDLLTGHVESGLHIDGCRLFIAQVCVTSSSRKVS